MTPIVITSAFFFSFILLLSSFLIGSVFPSSYYLSSKYNFSEKILVRLSLILPAFMDHFLDIASTFVAFAFTILKIICWDSFPIRIAPVVIRMFFLVEVQLMFIGILGEYIGAIHTYILNRPVVVEQERINLDYVTE
jgi:hypothetical protein